MKWKELVKIEPRLNELLKIAKAEKSNGERYCANHVWYGLHGLRSRLIYLVGWEANNPALRNSMCYDIAYEKIYEALPDCNHEFLGCW